MSDLRTAPPIHPPEPRPILSPPAPRATRQTQHTALLVMLILGLGLAVRLAAWQEARGSAIRGDEPDYVIPAETLTRTGRYLDTFITEQRTWTRVPLTALVLAAAFATQPALPPAVPATDAAWMAQRYAAGNLAMIVVSLGLLPLVMGLAAAAFPARRRRAAILAGALAAVYPPLITSAAQQLLSETLFMTLIFAALGALTRWQPHRRAWPWLVIAGSLFGLATLTRSATITFLPFLALWFWWVIRNHAAAGSKQQADPNNREPRAGARHMQPAIRNTLLATILVGGAWLATISPWTAYNYAMYGRLILLDTAHPTAFWHYNNFRGEDETARLAALPNPADRQALALQEGLANIAEYPGRFLQNVVDSLGYAWHLEVQSALKPNVWDLTRRDADVPATLPTDAAFLAVSLLGLAGLVALGWRRPGDSAGRVRRLLVLWVGYMLLVDAVIPADARFRLPAAPALIVFAAGLVASAEWRRVADPRRWSAVLRAHPAVAVATLVLCAWVIVGAASARIPAIVRMLTLAWQADHTADPTQAQALNTAAIAALPDSFWPYRHAADAARAAGQDDAARRLYGAAFTQTTDPRAVLGLADLVARHPAWSLTADEINWLKPDPDDLRGPVWNGFQPTPLPRLVVGGPGDWPYIAGFQSAEQAGGVPFRWSGGRAEIRLPAAPGAPPVTAVHLRMAAPPIGPPSAWPVTIRVDGAAPVVLQFGPAWADYTVPLTPAVSGTIRIHVDSPVRRPQDYAPTARDSRLLGVGVQWAVP
jgi:hypothetical protein